MSEKYTWLRMEQWEIVIKRDGRVIERDHHSDYFGEKVTKLLNAETKPLHERIAELEAALSRVIASQTHAYAIEVASEVIETKKAGGNE
jgi:hypothetical protein